MSVQDTKRRQDERIAAQQGKVQPTFDMEAFRQMLEDVVHTELQTFRTEQPTQQGPQQPFDMEAVQTVVRIVVRAELQGIQTTLTILTNAIQALTVALNGDTTT